MQNDIYQRRNEAVLEAIRMGVLSDMGRNSYRNMRELGFTRDGVQDAVARLTREGRAHCRVERGRIILFPGRRLNNNGGDAA